MGLAGATVITSPDAVAWTAHRIPPFILLGDVTYGEGQFVAVGNPGSILTSMNGQSWQQRLSPVRQRLWGVAYGNGTFVAVGDGGTIVQTIGPDLRFCPEYTRRSEDGITRFVMETPRGVSLQFQATEDFLNWEVIGGITNSPGVFEFEDTRSQRGDRRFYRAKRL